MYTRIRKRKNKKILQYSIINGGIFFFTILLLGIVTGKLWDGKYTVITPLAHAIQAVLANQADTTQIIQNVSKGLGKYAIPFESVDIDTDQVIHIHLKDNEEVLFSSEKSIDNQIASLQRTLNHFTIEGKLFKRIDFRFDKPVVVF